MTTNAATGPAPAGATPHSPAGGGLKAYRPTEGYRTRLVCFLIIAVISLYAGYQWFNGWPDLVILVASMGWRSLNAWRDSLGSGWQLAIGSIGGAFWAGYGLYTGYKYIYVSVPSVDFLIKTDMELHKVYWPKVKPWFDANTEAWNATYVVMAVVGILALYIFGIDWVFWLLARFFIYC
ncbi:MAG TPA: preprotein translocase subunit SecE [Planctomycetota bacterium]|nr:preprotein translocase subunit SecE [Planctomycetota bacterium]